MMFVASHAPGFVIALSARLWRPGCPPERHWLIASRWGADAEYLSVGFAGAAEGPGGAAPAGLAPHTTLLARWDGAAGPDYALADRLGPGVSLAGRFLPARGRARLGRGWPPLRLAVRGAHCLDATAAADGWQPFVLRAVCADWPDQFVEPGAA